jgi:O-antigen/teichoic acid export membrane protein
LLARELKRLGTQSAIYGLGGIVSRLIAVFLLPVYTVYLGTTGFGQIETIVALTAVLVIVLRMGITSAFFRFYFDSEDARRRLLVVRTSFWFTMAMATLGLAAGWIFSEQIADLLNLGDPWLVRAGFVGLWAQMNYAQMTSLFRVEERPVGFAIASVANVLITIGTTIALVVGFHKGAIGAVVGNFLGTLTVYVVLLAYRRYQLGLQFDRGLLRAMNRFGLPLVPAALALWAINLIDRLFINGYKGQAEVGIYSLAVRIASVIVFLMTAFQLAWPAFAYSIRDDGAARRTYAYVLTYLLFITCWMSLALGSLAPWLVDLLAPHGNFERSADAVPFLAFGVAAYSGYSVLAIGVGRTRQTQLNWVVTGAAALVNIVLCITLIPPYGMIGAAVATLVAYVALFLGMWLRSRTVYPVPYQWRRIVAYPLVLLPLRFYQRAELTRLRRLAPG